MQESNYSESIVLIAQTKGQSCSKSVIPKKVPVEIWSCNFLFVYKKAIIKKTQIIVIGA